MEGTDRRLMWHGMCLFLLGLLTGFAEQYFANMRMGLAAHLEGVMNGTFLVVLGAIWNDVRLSGSAKAIAFWTALYGTYGNWLVTTLAAAFGTAALSPITGAATGGCPGKRALSRLDSKLSALQSSPPLCSFSGVFAPEHCGDLPLAFVTDHNRRLRALAVPM
jgi:hydroxylaminobenzene mutase